MDVLIAIIGIIASGVLSWFFTHLYYRRSSKEIPEWAKPLVDRLPQSPPTTEEMIELFKGAVQGPDNEWHGVEIDGQFFAWRGPGLHLLPNFPPIPAPAKIHDALRGVGMSPLYEAPQHLREANAKGRMQVFETDKQTWRREVLLAGADQILMVQSVGNNAV